MQGSADAQVASAFIDLSAAMGFRDAIKSLFGGGRTGFDLSELSRRLGVAVEELESIQPQYHVYRIAKQLGLERRAIPLTAKGIIAVFRQ